MSVQTWAAHWRDALVAERRRSEPDAFSGPHSMQLAELAPAEDANPTGRIAFEHGVLALFDQDRREVLLAAVPTWSGALWVASDAKEQQRITRAIEDAAARNGLAIAVLPGPDGARRTVYTRAVPLGDLWLHASEPAWQFSVGIGGFTEPGTARAQDFADATGRAAAAFLAPEEYPAARDRVPAAAPIPVAPAATPAGSAPASATASTTGSTPAEDTPLLPPPAPRPGPDPAAGSDPASSGRAAAGLTGRSARILAVAGVMLLVGLGIVGVSRGYPVEVVTQEAHAETFRDVPTGRFDLVEVADDQLCGDFEAYQKCVDQHAALYRASCAALPLTEEGESVCAALRSFIDDSQLEADACGEDCYTAVDESGLWGWPRLRAVAETERVSNDDAQERRTRTEYCRFDLGPIEIGTCTR